jgi:hypothetical protein
VPCIVLDKNITYEHNPKVNYYIIKEHDNDHAKITAYLRNSECIQLKKNLFNNSKQYILDNFSRPRIFAGENTIELSKTKNDILLVAALRITREEDFVFFKNLLNYIKIVNNNRIDILLVIITDHIYNSNQKFIPHGKHVLFGIHPKEFDIGKYDKQLNLPHSKIIFCPNRGYDVGPMLIGLKYCEKINYSYVMHIHSKHNKTWRNYLLKICNYDIKTLGVDTIVCKNFFITCDKNDRNRRILNYYNDLFPNNVATDWQFNGGKMFITRFSYLKQLINRFAKIYNILTDIKKNDIFWQKTMLDENFITERFHFYKDNFFNIPISENSTKAMIETKSKNFFELLSHGVKGFPDCQIEHAIERYIGLLTIYNKKILKV